MNLRGFALALVLLVGVRAQSNVVHPPCDSPEVEEAALVAQDYLNQQHSHGYKYVLNRIEDIKILTLPGGGSAYVMELDLLETECHVLDPTPLANCTVRNKGLTAVEGDCDVVLHKVDRVLTVTAFKCKTEESTEDLCVGCPTLLPLNHTEALDLVQASLVTFNNRTNDITYSILEVGRMSAQLVSGGNIYIAEYVIVEANCTADPCVPLNDPTAARGICVASGSNAHHVVDCKMFSVQIPVVDVNSTAAPPVLHIHTESLSPKHGLRHHKLTAIHNPHLTALLSAESAESAEAVVPVVVNAATPATDPAVATADPAPAAAEAAPVDPAPTAANSALVVDDPAPAAAADPAPAAADPAPAAAADPAPAAADPAPASDSTSASDDSQSAEVPILLFKRDVPAADAAADAAAAVPIQPEPIVLVPMCPGRIRFF